MLKFAEKALPYFIGWLWTPKALAKLNLFGYGMSLFLSSASLLKELPKGIGRAVDIVENNELNVVFGSLFVP